MQVHTGAQTVHKHHHLHVQALDHLEEPEFSTHVFPTEQGKSVQFSKARLGLGPAEPYLWGLQRQNVCRISGTIMSKLKVA